MYFVQKTRKTHYFLGYAENSSPWHVTLHQFLWQRHITANHQRKSFSLTLALCIGIYKWAQSD